MVLREQDKFGRTNISERRPLKRENSISRGRNEEGVPEVWDMSDRGCQAVSTEPGFLSWIISDVGNLKSHLPWSSVKGLCQERCGE